MWNFMIKWNLFLGHASEACYFNQLKTISNNSKAIATKLNNLEQSCFICEVLSHFDI